MTRCPSCDAPALPERAWTGEFRCASGHLFLRSLCTTPNLGIADDPPLSSGAILPVRKTRSRVAIAPETIHRFAR